jgi:thiamine-phosphate pyrophosphorylase
MPAAMDAPLAVSRLRGLYALTPEGLNTETLLTRVEAAIAGGAALVQYRRKALDPARREAEARTLLDLCRRRAVPLIINDDAALARRTGADGVHLGREDGGIEQARRLLGSSAIVGASCYNELARAVRAERAGATYVAFGSLYASPTKPAAVRATIELLREARARLRVPVAAIGGITAENAPEPIAAGADLLAVLSDLFDAPDIRARAMQYARLWKPVGKAIIERDRNDR